MKAKLQKSAGCFGLLLLLTGCAFTTDKIQVNYNLRGAREKITGAEAVKVEVQVADKRTVRDRLGKKINAYGSEMGGIAAENDVVALVQQAINDELRLRGFAQGSDVLVVCDLEKFYNRFVTGFWAGDSFAEFRLKVEVKNRAGNLVFNRNVFTEGHEANIQVAGGHNAKSSLEQALSRGIQELFQDQAFLEALLKAGAATPAGQ